MTLFSLIKSRVGYSIFTPHCICFGNIPFVQVAKHFEICFINSLWTFVLYLFQLFLNSSWAICYCLILTQCFRPRQKCWQSTWMTSFITVTVTIQISKRHLQQKLVTSFIKCQAQRSNDWALRNCVWKILGRKFK